MHDDAYVDGHSKNNINASCMTISGGRTKQLDIFCRVTGFTSDFLSFIVVEFIRFFHEAIQFTSLWLLVRKNLFVLSLFRTPDANFDNRCQRCIAHAENFLCRCTSTFWALNCCGGIFEKSLSYLCEVVRINFSTDFWTSRNFWLQFCKYCGAI